MYEPRTKKAKRVKSLISATNWDKRVAAAQEDERKVLAVMALVKEGDSLNDAVGKVGGDQGRSTLKRWVLRYERNGLEGLIDTRTPRETKARIAALHAASPEVSAQEVAESLVEEGVKAPPSASSISKEFRRSDDRRKYAAAKERESKPKVVELPLAGAELLLAAELETGVMGSLTDMVMAIAREAKEAAGDAEPAKDTVGRNRLGHFTVKYNAERARKPGQAIAGYLRSAGEKAHGRVPTWPRFVRERRGSIARKVETLVLSWALADTKGWNSLRAEKVAGLQPLTGYAYMPSTLAKMTSALAISAAGDRFLEAVGGRWHQVASKRWGERGAIAALYVDNHAKEVWSSLYTLSGKVSHLNRVMPCITTTYVHTGAGAPLVAAVQSGAAPLAPRLLEFVEKTEKQLEEEVRRAVVIDAEGSTFDVLESFVGRNADETKSRIIVTPLRPSRAPESEIKHGPGSYYRPYREHDELRIGRATLTHKSSGRTLEIGTLEVRREHRETDTILLTNGLELGESGRDLADLYFARWPLQENAFKEGGALGLAEHRGNCADMVANIAVETKLEKLGRQRRAAETKLADLEGQRGSRELEAKKAGDEYHEATTELQQRRTKLDALIGVGLRDGKELGQAAVGHQAALARTEATAIANRKAQAKKEENRSKRESLTAVTEKIAGEEAKLSKLKMIRRLDVEPEKILTATKLALSLLITFALREYLAIMAMASQTFLSRVVCLPGRREIVGCEEIVILYENPRDPEVNQAVRAACNILNERNLRREERNLCYRVEPRPPASK